MGKKLTIDDAIFYAEKNNGKCLSTEYSGIFIKMKWECKFGHRWETTLNDIKNKKHWCPKCAGITKHTLEDCHNLAKLNNGKCLSENYLNGKSHLLWECKFGHKWKANFFNVQFGTWCPYCSKNVKLDIDECRLIAKNKGGECLSTVYINIDSKIEWKCSVGHIWKATLYQIKNRNNWCPYCAKKAKHTIDDCYYVATHNGGKCLEKEFKNVFAKMRWECKFGHIWTTSFHSIDRGTWCPCCAGTKKHTLEYCHSIAKLNGGKCLSENYLNGKSHLLWECKFGHKFKTSLENIQKGHWCHHCNISGKVSRDKLFNILKSIFPNFEIKINYRSFNWLIGPNGGRMELDFYIPFIFLAIEYDGFQHFVPHSFKKNSNDIEKQNNLKSIQLRDQLKNKLISEHPEEIHHFIRIPYTTDLTEENVRNILKQKGIIN